MKYALLFLAAWLCMSWVLWKWNPATWGEGERYAALVVALAGCMAVKGHEAMR